jgi:hypothetical protein
MKRTLRIFAICYTAGFVVLWIRTVSHSSGLNKAIFVAAFVLIMGLYLLPTMLFGATIEAGAKGIEVNQYRNTMIPYTAVRQCWGFYLFPNQIVILTTSLPLPLKVILADDAIKGPRRSLTQLGTKASTIRKRMQGIEIA